jgi:SPP1 gp7 family putative phage head morphogenesis protein
MQPVTFLEALNYAKQRKILLPDDFYTLDLKTRQMATTVSFLSSLEQIQTVINGVNKTLANGGTFKDFQKLIDGSEIVLPKHYLDNVFRTNIQNAYSHGRWQQQQRNKAKRPYLMYSSIEDSRTRPKHLALNRIIRHIDDPFWLTYYPPLGFRCRCTVIALTEKEAMRLGITPDDKLPQIAEELGWSSHPINFGDLSNLVDKKILESGLDSEFLIEQKNAIQAEWTASKKLTSLFAPMNDKSRDLFNTITDTVIPLDPNIRPSAIKTLLDYVQGDDNAITAYLNSVGTSLADDVLKRWLKSDLAVIESVAKNTAPIIVGSATVQQIATYQVGHTITSSAPFLMVNSGGDITIHILNADGLGIDLSKLGLSDGVLMPIGLSYEVVSIEPLNGKMVYTLKALVN